MPRIVQHWRTSTAGLAPTPGSLLPGQLAVEMGAPAKLWVGVPVADDPTQQKLLIDTSAVGGPGITEPVGAGTWGRLQTAAWQRSVALAGDTMTGLLLLSGDAVAPLGAVPLQQLNAAIAALPPPTPALVEPVGAGAWGRLSTGLWQRAVEVDGDTMTGLLLLSGDAVAPLGAVPLQQLNAAIAALPPIDLTPYVEIAGDTMTGDLTLPNLIATGNITAAGDATINGGNFIVNGATGVLVEMTAAAGQIDFGLSSPTGSISLVASSGPALPLWNLILASSGNRDFVLQRFNDAGTYIGNAIAINRVDSTTVLDGVLLVGSGRIVSVGTPTIMPVVSLFMSTGAVSGFAGLYMDNVNRRLNVGELDINGAPVAQWAHLGPAGLLGIGGADDLGIAFTTAERRMQFSAPYAWSYSSGTGDLTWVANNIAHLLISQSPAPRPYEVVNLRGPMAGVGAYFDYSSDARAKENIVPMTEGLAEILALNPVKFNRKPLPSQEAVWPTELGFIAQEVEPVIPEAVPITGLVLDDQGTGGKDTGDPTRGLIVTHLIPVLVNAVKEMDALITDLTARVASLEIPPAREA